MLQIKKQLSLILLFLFAVGLISAVTIYSGDSYEIELNESYDYYSVVGNLSPVECILNSNGSLTIIPYRYSQNDSFEIIFFNEKGESIPCPSCGGGGGSSKTIYQDRNITKYIDKKVEVIKEVPGATITVEKEVNAISTIGKVSIGLGFIFILIMGLILGRMFFGKKEPDVELEPTLEDVDDTSDDDEESNSETDTDTDEWRYE